MKHYSRILSCVWIHFRPILDHMSFDLTKAQSLDFVGKSWFDSIQNPRRLQALKLTELLSGGTRL